MEDYEEEFLEIVGTVHNRYPELDNDNYFGTYIKPSEFERAVLAMKGLPVTMGHTRDQNGNITQVVGNVVDAYIDKENGGDIKAKIYIPINSEVAQEVKYEILDNPINPKRNLSFAANIIEGVGPGVPGKSDQTIFNAAIDFEKGGEVAIVDKPGVPKSKIRSAVNGVKNLYTGEIKYRRREIYKNLQNKPKVVGTMETNQSAQTTDVAAPQAETVAIVRPTPTNMADVRVGPPPGGLLEKDLAEQKQQLGIPNQSPVLSYAQQRMAQDILAMQAEKAALAKEREEAKAFLVEAQQQRQQAEAYVKQVADEKRKREEEQARAANAALLEEEKRTWAIAEIDIIESKDATALAEFYAARDAHFEKVATGKLSPEVKWQKAVAKAAADLTISGVQARQENQMKINGEKARILEDNYKRAKLELEKEKEDNQELNNALAMAAANVADPQKAFDILAWQKNRQQQQQPPQQQAPPQYAQQQYAQQQYQQPGVQPYQPPNQYGYQHLQPNQLVQAPLSRPAPGAQPPPVYNTSRNTSNVVGRAPYQQQKQYNNVPQIEFDPNASLEENVAANIKPMFFTPAEDLIQYKEAVATASLVLEQEPALNDFLAVPEFAARNNPAYKRIMAREGAGDSKFKGFLYEQ